MNKSDSQAVNLNIVSLEKGLEFSKPYTFDLSFHTQQYGKRKMIVQKWDFLREWKKNGVQSEKLKEEETNINRDEKK